MSIATNKNTLFVDDESAGKVDLSAIPADVFVAFFLRHDTQDRENDLACAMRTLFDRFCPWLFRSVEVLAENERSVFP